jgi:hypothetical protein
VYHPGEAVPALRARTGNPTICLLSAPIGRHWRAKLGSAIAAVAQSRLVVAIFEVLVQADGAVVVAGRCGRIIDDLVAGEHGFVQPARADAAIISDIVVLAHRLKEGDSPLGGEVRADIAVIWNTRTCVASGATCSYISLPKMGPNVDSLALFPVPETDLATLDERARTYAEAARADRTQRAYRSRSLAELKQRPSARAASTP